MMRVSASLFERLRFFWRRKHVKTDGLSLLVEWKDVLGFERQEHLRVFQLESLILAQNERWRQA